MILRSLILATAALALICACGAAADEYRGIWITGWSNGFLNQTQVDNLLGVPGNATSIGEIRKANLNTVFVQVRRRADVCYPSGMGEPYFSGLSPSNFNALQAIIKAAHDTTGGKQRIEVHCWMVTFATDGGAVYSRHNNPADPANYWMTRDQNGNETEDKAMDPGHPKCSEYLTDVCMDLVRNFDIDGIHFDYVRFTANNQGYNPTSIARYNARYGLTGQPAPNDEQFAQWRRDQITQLMRKIYAKIQTIKPWVKQSGSFVTWNPSPTSSTRAGFQGTRAYYDVYSDWDSWMQEGIMDMAVPMTYYDNASSPNDYIRWMNFMKDRKANRFVLVGPGTYLNYLQDAINQVKQTRDPSPAGNYANGFSIYDYQSPYATVKSPLTYGTWANFKAQLLAQVTPTPANIPQMPWKTTPTKGHIGGTVTFADSRQWADGAFVNITGPESRRMFCDGTGFYAFIDLTPGTYTIRVSGGRYCETKTAIVSAGGISVNDFALSIVDNTPPVISNLQITNISDYGADISWSTDDVATGQVEYGLTSSYGMVSGPDSQLIPDHAVSLTGLTPGTTYHYRVKSTNGAGLTSYSPDRTFNTLVPPQSIIIDELDPQWTSSGAWSPGTSNDGWDGGYKTCSSVTGTATKSCVWTPTLSRAGTYDISVYYREGSNRTTSAKFNIISAGGTKTVTVNQQVGRTWIKIASGVRFDAGTSGKVTLNNVTGDGSGKIVVADAVKFDYTSDLTPPTMLSVTPTDAYTTSTTSLRASWSATDPESGISSYQYAVGTSMGATDVKGWTSAGAATSFTINGLSLKVGGVYYISARAVNGYYLTSTPLSCGSTTTVVKGLSNVAEARGLADNTAIALPVSSVSMTIGGGFFVQDANRISGIRIGSYDTVSVNQTVQVFGILKTASSGERYVDNVRIIQGAMGPVVKPLGMLSKSVGGVGPNNMGLLVRIAGTVTAVTSDGFYVDDGCGLTDNSGNKGIRVWTGVVNSAAVNARVGVTGAVSSVLGIDNNIHPVIMARDIKTY